MKKTVKILLPSILVICLCVSMISGATFALFTSDSSIDITVSSGKVNVESRIENLQYAADVTETFDEWIDAVADGDALTGTFPVVGGGVRLQGNALSLTEFIPGDAVQFELNITNNSTVAVKYRVRLIADESVLAQYLKVTVDGEPVELKGTTALVSWTDLAVGDEPSKVAVRIVLPASVTHEQVVGGADCKLSVSVLAVQGNGPDQAPCDETGEHSLNSDGVCFYCGKKVVESTASSVEQFNDLLDEIQDPDSEVHVELSQDLIGSMGDIVVKGTAEFNFGTHQCRATSTSNGKTLTAQDGGKLTINAEYPGSSTKYTAGMLIASNGGQITINGNGYFKGGNYQTAPPYQATINADNGIITINGGSFNCSTGDTLIKAFNGGTVIINSGKIGGSVDGTVFSADGGTIIVGDGAVMNSSSAHGSVNAFSVTNGGKIIISKSIQCNCTAFYSLEEIIEDAKTKFNVVDNGTEYIITEKA